MGTLTRQEKKMFFEIVEAAIKEHLDELPALIQQGITMDEARKLFEAKCSSIMRKHGVLPDDMVEWLPH